MKSNNLRIFVFLSLVLVAFLGISYQLFQISYLRHAFYINTAEAQTERTFNVLTRGNIFISDKDGATHVAATNKKFPSIAVVPTKVLPDQLDDAREFISSFTTLPKDKVDTILRSKSDYLRILPGHITNEQVAQIKEKDLRGVSVSYVTDRYYPNASLASDVIGFLGYDGNNRSGQYGIESFYDKDLFGTKDPTALAGVTDTLLSLIPGYSPASNSMSAATARPKDVVLTIDKNIQDFVEDKLDTLLKQWSATKGSIIVQDPITGKILAMVDRPTFDPNAYASADQSTFLNSNLQEIFEPGSSFKPFTMAAGLDSGKVTPQTTFEDTGSVQIAGYKIKNFSDKVFGKSTMTQVLEKSINTGVMFVENAIGDDTFLNYIINLGFGQRTGIDLPGEVNGDVTNLYAGRKINFLTASFGQGIAVTPLQLINGYSAIANGGKLMRPYIVEKVVGEGGNEVATKPEILGIPFSEKTATKLKTMLVSVVDVGFDKARITGYDVAGKTGTAQIPAKGGGYLADQYIHSFAGFAPAYNPKFVILIKMDKPQGITFAADSLSPVFRDIAAFLLQYYNIPPSR